MAEGTRGEEVIKNTNALLSKPSALDHQINQFDGFGAAQPAKDQTWESSNLYFMYDLRNADSTGKGGEEQVPTE